MLNIKRRLSVFYYIVELLKKFWKKQIVETNWRNNYCWNHLETVQMLTMIVIKQMVIGEKNIYCWNCNYLLKKYDGLLKRALPQVRMCRPPPPQFCFHFNEKCAQCWFDKWNNEKSIFRFLIFELTWKFIENWQFWV